MLFTRYKKVLMVVLIAFSPIVYCEVDTSSDTDNDGVSDLIESLLGSDPNNINALPAVTDNLNIDFNEGLPTNIQITPTELWSYEFTNTNIGHSYRASFITEETTSSAEMFIATNFERYTLINIIVDVSNADVLDNYDYSYLIMNLHIEGKPYEQAYFTSLPTEGLGILHLNVPAGPQLLRLITQVDMFSKPDIPLSFSVTAIVSGNDDPDNDGILSTLDNCPLERTDLTDTDGDGLGDACDFDIEQDSDQDGILNINDNCPIVYNPYQEEPNDGSANHGYACNTDDDKDGLPDSIEDTLDYRDSRFREPLTDSDGDGANDVYELNTGTDPFVANTFSDINLIDYFPMGDATFTYKAFVNLGIPKYLTEYQQEVESAETSGVFIDNTGGYFGESINTYKIGKDALLLIAKNNGEQVELPASEIPYIPYRIQEGGTFTGYEDEDCLDHYCDNYSISILDKGVMTFKDQEVSYITVSFADSNRDANYIYLKDIGLYGVEYAYLVDYTITNRVNIEALAANSLESSEPKVASPENKSSSKSSGGAINLFWLLIAGVAVMSRRRLMIQ
ncbi:MAG: hypothetical protein ACJA2K_000657 [Thalassolituus sp.]|jgi:hypothetical protein